MSVFPILYRYNYPSNSKYSVIVSINEFNGAVSISHGGIEMGQGLNIKVGKNNY